ncbi:hypothetical protein [Frigidibacter sp. ROC022]|uniref:hypothetical protein n=1 Tax=Frigidibacter sp. ROC022 TaxID=2971796 RepID=UPI00215AFFF2|nr:hypothetical protein [Frigidibacter sp. ROC022]MCR8723587.1 hypothetical protein [Frigidibacter sp. ROC022]
MAERHGTGLAAALILGATLPAQAGSLGFGNTEFEGRLAAVTRLEDQRITPALSGDLSFALPLFGGPLGLEIGLFGLATDLDTPHETYGTLTLELAAVKLAAGVPRPAFDGVAVSVLDRLVPISGLDEARIATTRSRVTWGAMYGHYLPLGLSASGQSGAIGWAVSAHQVDQQDLQVVGAGLDWQSGDWSLAAALEWASDGGFGGKVQAVRQIGDIRLGGTVFVAPLPGAEDRGEAFVSWHAGQHLDLTGALQVARDSGDALALMAADYGIGDRGHLTAALISDAGDPALDLGLGWDF